MSETIRFLMAHGYAALIALVLAEQLGLPIPASPFLLAAGALAGAGRLSLAKALAYGVLAAVIGNAVWYGLGRRFGGGVLRQLCRISLEPDSCVRQTENIFARFGARSLLVVRFIPGLSAVTTPLAGVFKVHPGHFLLYDVAGAALWVGVFEGLGYLFSNQLERVAHHALRLGSTFLILLLAALAGYLAWKYIKRRNFLRQLDIARITPEELKARIDAGEDVVIVDVRHSLEFEASPETIPGAIHLPTDKMDEYEGGIPRDRDIILYCT
jgi:membrane protein DedA with SNARE-associated domain